jgi:hypothetical protein
VGVVGSSSMSGVGRSGRFGGGFRLGELAVQRAEHRPGAQGATGEATKAGRAAHPGQPEVERDEGRRGLDA